MFVLTPKGVLINLDNVKWIDAGNYFCDANLFAVNSDVGMLTEPMTREEAETVMAQIVQLVEVKVLGSAKGASKCES